MDLRSLTEAACLNPSNITLSTVEDYKEKVMLSLSSAPRDLAVGVVKKSQDRYKRVYGRNAVHPYHHPCFGLLLETNISIPSTVESYQNCVSWD